jgi:hypothetical protein
MGAADVDTAGSVGVGTIETPGMGTAHCRCGYFCAGVDTTLVGKAGEGSAISGKGGGITGSSRESGSGWSLGKIWNRNMFHEKQHL